MKKTYWLIAVLLVAIVLHTGKVSIYRSTTHDEQSSRITWLTSQFNPKTYDERQLKRVIKLSNGCNAEFSVDEIVTEGHKKYCGRTYVTKSKIASSEYGDNITIITNGDGTVYTVYSKDNEYEEYKSQFENPQDFIGDVIIPRNVSVLAVLAWKPKERNIEYLGRKVINGRQCEGFHVSWLDGKPGKVTTTDTMWIDPKLNWIVRLTERGLRLHTLRKDDGYNHVYYSVRNSNNFQIGKQPPSVFKVPKGYKRIYPYMLKSNSI